MRADLHLHSLCSDGKYAPAEIASKCKEAGLSLFSLTDHDSMEGVFEAVSAAKELGICCVPVGKFPLMKTSKCIFSAMAASGEKRISAF